jgi:hypothetical protein
MERSSESFFSRAARAVAGLTRYGAHNIYETIGDITQHLADCQTKNKEKTLVAGIPFVLVWTHNESEVECVSCNCSKAEFEWLFEKIVDKSILMEQIGALIRQGGSSVSLSGSPSIPMKELPAASFKAQFYRSGAKFLSFRFDQRGNNTKRSGRIPATAVTVVLPGNWKASKIRSFRNAYINEFLATLNTHLDENDSFGTRNSALGHYQVEYFGLPEDQSSFSFLQETLQGVLDRIKVRISNGSDHSTREFVATFLFRIATSPIEMNQRYRYVFTHSQIENLKELHLSDVAVDHGSVLDNFKSLPAIQPLLSMPNDVLEEWLNTQQGRSLEDLLADAQWYGEKSFASYVGSLSRDQSMYISNWRIWYSPKELYRSDDEEKAFKDWLNDNRRNLKNDPRSEPLARLLRSEVEQHHFGLRSMFMIPIYGKPDESPAAIVQISAAKLSETDRVDYAQLVGFAYNEILGYLRADVLRGKLLKRAKFDQFVDLAHLFTHAGTKQISTPIHNTFKRFDNAFKYRRFREADKIDRWSIDDALFTTRTLETTLGTLKRFKGIGGQKNGKATDLTRLMGHGIGWIRIQRELRAFLGTAFFRHFWNVCHDREYKRFRKFFADDRINPLDIVKLDFRLDPQLPRCLGHTDMMIMHLSNLVENAIESFDLRDGAVKWERHEESDYCISFRLEVVNSEIEGSSRTETWVVLRVSNNATPTSDERYILASLNRIFGEIARQEGDAFLYKWRDRMINREFTSKSGGSHGWALLEFASYLRRLELRNGDTVVQHGTISVRSADDTVEFEIRLPIKTNASDFEYFLEYSEENI